MNNEKAVFTFEKVNDTIIKVVEALGGVREQEVKPVDYSQCNWKWAECISRNNEKITVGKWYHFVKNAPNLDSLSFANDDGFFYPLNEQISKCFNFKDVRPYNPDYVKELVGKKVKHIPSGEYHEFAKCNDDACEVKGVAVRSNDVMIDLGKKSDDMYCLYADYDLSDYQDIEETLYVPDEVKFYEWGGRITLEVSESLGLSKDPDEDAPFLCGIKNAYGLIPIKCKLVPVKYDHIQVGDFVVSKYAKLDNFFFYAMKHGEDKFCGADFNSFMFNEEDWYDSDSDLLKVVKV
jgi:hypothetical protein